jgi:hypothetical protein
MEASLGLMSVVLELGLLMGFAKKPAQTWAYPWAWVSPSPNAVIVKEESPGSVILVDCM